MISLMFQTDSPTEINKLHTTKWYDYMAQYKSSLLTTILFTEMDNLGNSEIDNSSDIFSITTIINYKLITKSGDLQNCETYK